MAAESDGNTANYAHALRKQPWNKLQNATKREPWKEGFLS